MDVRRRNQCEGYAQSIDKTFEEAAQKRCLETESQAVLENSSSHQKWSILLLFPVFINLML